MAQTIETRISRFDGGIVNDPRDRNENTARMVSGFDVLTFPRKMIPYRQSESGDSSASTSQKRNFLIAQQDGVSGPYSLYALGVQSAQPTRAEILYKSLTQTGTTDMTSATWATPSANQSASGATNFNLFVFYRRTGFIYGAKAGTSIWRFDPAGGAFVEQTRAITYTQIGQGIVHSKDDNLYIPYFNNTGGFIEKLNNATWSTALTLPVHYIPTSICEYGNYLAIACANTDGVSNSRIFLWDRNESTTTLAESIDGGSGSVMIIEEVDGELIWISQKGGTATSFTGIPNSVLTFKDKVYFRKLVGNIGVKFFELHSDRTGGSGTTSLPHYKQKIDNRLYFQMIIRYNGSVRDGIWSIGRSSPGSSFSLVNEYRANNNTALATGDKMFGFIIVGDFFLQGYGSGGSGATYNISKSVATGTTTFTANSIYESKPFDGSIHGFDNTYYKDLVEVGIMTEPYELLTGNSMELDYQTDANIGTSTWTTIFTNTTDNSISHMASNIESNGNPLPTQYKQIAFRIISTGGAPITGLVFKESVTGKKFIAD